MEIIDCTKPSEAVKLIKKASKIDLDVHAFDEGTIRVSISKTKALEIFKGFDDTMTIDNTFAAYRTTDGSIYVIIG